MGCDLEDLFPLSPKCRQQLETSLQDVSYVVLDMEMTGGNPEKNSIIEISALKCQGGKILDRYHQLIRPEHNIPYRLRRMTGITPQMVRFSPRWYEVLEETLLFIGSSVIVAHNIHCDLQFLKYYAAKLQPALKVENFYLCTHNLAVKFLADAPKKNLTGLCEHLGISVTKAHRAEADSLMTWNVFERLRSLLQQSGCYSLEDALRVQEDYISLARIGWMISKQSLKSLPSSLGVFAFWKDDSLLCCGASSHIASDIAYIAQNRDAVGKGWHRRILNATGITSYPSDHLLHALCKQSQLEQDQGVLQPSSVIKKHSFPWKVCDSLFLQATEDVDAEILTLSFGSICAHPTWVFGPVKYYAQGKELLTYIASHIPDISFNGRKYVLPNSQKYMLQLSRLLDMWRCSYGGDHQQQIDLVSLCGIITVPYASSGDMQESVWDVYGVYRGYVYLLSLRFRGSRSDLLQSLNQNATPERVWWQNMLRQSKLLEQHFGYLQLGVWLVTALHCPKLYATELERWRLGHAYFDAASEFMSTK